MKKEKNKFILGIVSAVAILSLIGFIVMSVAYLKKDDSDKAKAGESANQAKNPSPPPTPAAPPAPTANKPVNIKVSKDDHIRGNFDAPITIVEYSDFQCPYCSRFHDTMTQVMENYPNDVRWVYKNFPLDSLHPYARKAAEAAECAADQGKFWEYADGLFANQRSINSDYFPALAKKLGLNASEFDKCFSSGKYSQKVNDNSLEGRQNGVTGTPGSYINGQKLGGAVPYEKLKPIIDSLK